VARPHYNAGMALMNLDAGEYDDEPEELWAQFDYLNIACGGHAGDAASMARVVSWCVATGRVLGAHPGYPDRAGFGRRTLAIEPGALGASIREQCAALGAVAARHDRKVQYVKPHGQLYHDANASPAIAAAVVDGAADALGNGITIVGPPRGALREAAAARGVGFASEGFADRRMRPDGGLVPRSEPGALLLDPAEAAAQAVRLDDQVDTICCHADTPGSLEIARAVHKALRG
jgi:UPF0271 protein